MKTQDLGEEKNDSQPAATPLAASVDSHQRVSDRILDIDEEMNNPQLIAMPLNAASAGSHQPVSFNNQGIEEEKKQVPTMHLAAAAGSHHPISDGSDFDANLVALDLPTEGSVVVVDT